MTHGGLMSYPDISTQSCTYSLLHIHKLREKRAENSY